ncbi:barren [Wallemia mellicola]|uniref:Condensin complex subunit 2 n=2 Tax=Wallemia mellicola TaxID=1708541 RepID=A0A4T0QWU3_9BASI|nr:barren [Wallemia mellicola]TIC29696.1 barren [Wallemia mellicola]TIC38135.1 barren [Wallemia mellicola]TIC56661.1 barren [Wallemia mellicola]TIC70280.1 barren [Wallemia mellicola]
MSSDTDSSLSPPRPSKRNKRSEFKAHLNDTTATSAARRQSNYPEGDDDAAEKRRRRKSHYPDDDTSNKNSPSHKTKNMNVGSRVARHKLATTIAPQPAGNTPALSLDVMTTNFEEWMKMATDNKINAANTWNFALIDYFADMSLLRNDDNQNSINFQKASCTLDGCVKIWTSRVDSVATEAGKLINGLSAGGTNDREEAANNEDESDAEEVTEKVSKKRRAPRTGSTLVSDFNSIKAKEFELELAVDPLFKKTSADFDEGGAGGLLMNHLGVDGVGRVIFDSSDVVMVEDEDEYQGTDQDPRIDIKELQSKFLSSIQELDEKEICPSLSTFKFSLNPTDEDLTENPFERPVTPQDEKMEFQHDDQDDFGGGADMADVQMDDFFDSAANDEVGEIDEEAWTVNPTITANAGGVDEDGWNIPDSLSKNEEQQQQVHTIDQFDPSGDGNMVMSSIPINSEGMFDYFDKNMMKGWAGPEHWGVRRSVKRDAASAPKKEKSKEDKTIPMIDFDEPTKSNSKTLFMPPTARGAGSASIMMPKKNRDGEFLLPDDIHFNSKQLLKLFLKPKVSLRMKSSKLIPGGNQNNDNADAAAFWAGASEGLEFDDGEQPPAAPLDSQFFQEDDPDMGDDLVSGELDPGHQSEHVNEDDALAATHLQQLNKVRPEFVNYSKRAKRVDVRALKDNIWKSLEAPDGDDEAENVAPGDNDEKKEVGKKFSSVIDGLKSSYPTEKLNDLSTSFCFICLLHLCNEHNLNLETFAKHALDPEQQEKGSVVGLDRVMVNKLANYVISQT